MNFFTFKWFCKFFTSLRKFNPQLKKAKEMKATMSWQEYKPFVDKQVRSWLSSMVDLAGVEFVAKGQDKIPLNGPVIYTPNHSGAFDIPAVILTAPVVPMFMAKKELLKLPIINKWMDVVDCVFVDRNNKNTARSSLQDAIDKVKTGRSLVIFPEGTRSKDGKMGEFRGGAMKVAMETGATVVPVLIEGSRERLEATSNVTPGRVYVTFLDPIETKRLTKDDFYRMPSEIRSLLQAERDRNN